MLTLWLAAAAVAAQTTAAAQSPTTAPKPPDKVTITGCVERADEMEGSGGTVGTTTDSLHFVLVSIPARQEVGTTGAKPTSDKGYRLDGDVKTLNPHVGHEVEITGFVDAAATTSGSATSFTGPMVKVQSVKMLSETCRR